MNAKEFIKKHGWSDVIAAVKGTNEEETSAFESKDVKFLDDKNPVLGFSVTVYKIPYLEVRKYTEAYELVQAYGGLRKSKSMVKLMKTNLMEDLSQAINLVEEVGKISYMKEVLKGFLKG